MKPPTNSTVVYRSNFQRVGAASGFSLAFFLFTIVTLGNLAEPYLPAGGAVYSLVCVVRAMRSGYLALSDDKVVVRTLLRRRVFLLADIECVKTSVFLQVTLRVCPVLHFRNGTTYNLSEFFMQKPMYNHNPDNKVNRVVNALNAALQK